VRLIERRQHDADSALNLACVRGLVCITGMLAVGSIGLAAFSKPVPEFFGNAILTAIGIIGGFIARGVMGRAPSAVSTGSVETVNVSGDTTQEAEATHGA
jgi:hypothetical protein